MADRIKGITVEIGGDVTGLNKALETTNKEINSTQSQLKDVERLLKLDPTNTELLAQKQRLLGEAVGGTEEKLKILKNAEAQAQAQFAKGEISQQQYEGLQREIAATEAQLKRLEQAAEQSNKKLEGVSTAAKKIGDAAGSVASTMAPVSAGIAAAGAAAVKAMDNVDQGLDTVMKKTGATGEEAKALQKVYNDVATTIPGDFGDIGAAVGEVNTRLELTGDDLKTAAQQFLKFAAINDTDVNTSVQLVTRAMGDAGIAADEYGTVLDALTVAGQKSGISVDKLAENLAKYGAPLRALGVDTEQAIAMFAGWEKAGVNTEIAFSGMKKAISTWGNAGKDAAVEFEKTLAGIKEAPDIATATTMAIEAFGAKAGPDLADAIRGGRFEVQDYINALKKAGGAVDSTYGMIVDEVDDSALALQTIQVAAHDMGETIAKNVGPAFLDIAKAVQALFEKFGELDPGMQQIILGAIALVAAIAPMAKMVQGISAAVGLATTVIGAISGGIAIFTGAATTGSAAATAFAGALTFITGPAGAVIAIIAAVVAAVVLLWNNCEGFRDVVTTAWAVIQEAFATFMDWLQATFAPVWDTIVGAMGTVFDTFKQALGIAWDAITQVFQAFGSFLTDTFGVTWDNTFTGAQTVFETVGQVIQTIVGVLTELFKTWITFITTVFLAQWKSAWQNIVNFFTAFKDNVAQVIEGIKTMFKGVIDFVTGVFTGDWTKAWQGVQNIFKGIFDALVGIVKIPINGIIGIINSALGAVNGLIKGVNKLLDGLRAVGVKVPTIPTIPEIAYLAKGGILEAGNAIVGEKGPELLTMSNGRARVTPLEDDGRGAEAHGAPAEYNQTLNFYTAAMTPAEVARTTRNATRRMIAGVKA